MEVVGGVGSFGMGRKGKGKKVGKEEEERRRGREEKARDDGKERSGKRRHLVQYERHWMEEQRTGGGDLYKHNAGQEEMKQHRGKDSFDGKRGKWSWFGKVAGGWYAFI